MKAPFTVAVLNWFSQHQRMLPWRMTKDPYAIWLSEIILQQTRIQQGMDYWYRFMRRWPYVEKLANATEDEVLREWQGLGYYSRARNLHVAARQIVELGHFPDTFDEIRKLKGVGDYTAAAIASIAFLQGVGTLFRGGHSYQHNKWEENFHGFGTRTLASRPACGFQSSNDGLWSGTVHA